MKIILIRHGKPNIEEPDSCTATEFEAWIEASQDSSPAGVQPMNFDKSKYKLYSSDAMIALETAKSLFGEDAEITATDMLREIPFKAFDDTAQSLPLKTWYSKAASQQKKGDPRQAESMRDAAGRASDFVDLLEKDGYDSIVVSHMYFLKQLFKELQKRGYMIERTHYFTVDYLERARASKRRDHCGCCTQNCLLSNPGCQIGQDIASRDSSFLRFGN